MTLTATDILNILKVGRPVSIIRAGDGECQVLRSNESIDLYRGCIKNVMTRQMGYEPTMGDVDAIRQNLITAYNNADIVGLPNHKQMDRLSDHWKLTEQTVKPYCTTQKFTYTDVAYDMLYNGMLDEWLMNKKRVVYIGCRDIDEGLKRRFNIGIVHSYIIAPEAKFTSGYSGLKHYPEQFNQMEWWMNAVPSYDGVPCIVGAGVIGKIYCNWFRDRGGVAFDIGAVMDLWAGFSTRGATRGLDTPDNRYKL